MSAKIIDIRKHDKPKFMGLIGLEFERGNITYEQAVKQEDDWREYTLAAISRAEGSILICAFCKGGTFNIDNDGVDKYTICDNCGALVKTEKLK